MSLCNDLKKIIDSHLVDIIKLRRDRSLKKDGSFVTKGDLLCQNIILDYISSHLPEYELVSEEMNLEDFKYDKNKNYIVLDPVDGTENFTSGLKEWGVSISVYKEGRHAESMIFLPELGLSISTGDSIMRCQSRIHGLSSSLRKEHLLNLKDGLEYRMTGCSVYNLYNVIMGSFISFENPKGACSWDIIAGLNLALEQGLKVSVEGKKYEGEFLYPSKKYKFRVESFSQ